MLSPTALATLSLFHSLTFSLSAAVPLEWTATPRNPAPAAFDRHHGETLDFRCTFAGWEGRAPSRPFADTADIRLWYQTNGMGSAWWSVPATISSNVLAATFPPQADPGADRLALFFGAPSNAYASAILRLRPSPGFLPNVLPPPDATSWATELAALRSLIDYSPSNSTLVATIESTEIDPTVPAWAKSETPPPSMSTHEVCAIVTNEVAVWGITSVSTTNNVVLAGYPKYDYDGNSWKCNFAIDGALRTLYDEGSPPEAGEQLSFYDAVAEIVIIVKRGEETRNALGLAKVSDVEAVASEAHAATMTNGAQAATLSNHSSRLSQLSQTVSTWETYWDGDEVRVTVTNFDSAVHLPSLYIEHKLENTNAYRTVWDERTRWDSNDVQMAEMRSAIDGKADRAWGYYDSHTGYYAPDGYTWLSSPKIAIAGGLAYQRTLTNDGAIWVLVSNGMVAETGGTMTNGFFRIKDDEGNTTFEIVRGNKRTVGATAAGIKVTRSGSSNIVTVPYNVVSEVHPTIYGTVSLYSPEWEELDADWLGQSGAWTAQVATVTSTYFIKGEYEIGGETYIKNVAPISAEGGIYCTDNIHKVRPVYNNGTITWEVVQ